MRHLAFAVVASLALVGTTRADMLYADFTILNGGYVASGGQVVFTLNGDGSIAASMVSYGDDIYGFGFNSATANLPESGFSPDSAFTTGGWTDIYGTHASGFSCSSCTTSENWTIDGNYASVFAVLNGGTANSHYDFFFISPSRTDEWAAVAVAGPDPPPDPPAPEPSSLMLLGTGVLGLAYPVFRRRSGKHVV